MARLLRVQYPGAIYHVTLRGNNRRALFRDDLARERFLERLADYTDEFQVRLYLFCLMSNHVHLLLETPQANLSAFMQRLETAYTVYFNLRHGETGHVLDNRFGAVTVEGDDYLLRLSRYVHLNPVHVGTVKAMPLRERIKALRSYRWSSYRSYTGKDRELPFVDYAPVLALMHGRARQKKREYERYVETGLAENDDEFQALMRGSRLGIGGSEFQEWMQQQHAERILQTKRPEDAALRRVGERIDPDEVVRVVCRELGETPERTRERQRETWLRPIVARMLGKYSGLTQRGIAERLGVTTGVSVCKQLGRLRDGMKEDAALARRVTALDTTLAARVRAKTERNTAKL